MTLVDESTFAISDRNGDIEPGGAQGLFFRDTRILSRLELRIDGSRLEPLAALTEDPFSATFVSRGAPSGGRADSTLMVFRSRYVGQGMREDLTIHNFSSEAAVCTVEVFVDSDFADLFAVKEGRAGQTPTARSPERSTRPASPSRTAGAPPAGGCRSGCRPGPTTWTGPATRRCCASPRTWSAWRSWCRPADSGRAAWSWCR